MSKIVYLFLFVFLFSLVNSAELQNPANTGLGNYNSGTQFSNPSFSSYYNSGNIGTYWPELDSKIQDGQCEVGTDFAVMIPPAGCTPYVVRSDLLEEQNVPVFCKLESLQLNPLIKVSSIKSISFKGKYPETIASVSYHPSRAALRSYNTLLGSPIVNNIGYVVIVLKKQKNESSMPKFVEGNLTATLSFDAKNAFGTGQSEYLLEQYNEQNWQDNWNENTFWNGKGILRVENIDGNRATIELLTNKDDVFSKVTLREGETSGKIYFPGFYCKAGVRVKLNSLVADENKALLDIDGNDVWVREGSRILDSCVVRSVELSAGDTGKVSISCQGIKQFDLILQNSYKAKINGQEFKVGENVTAPGSDGNRLVLAYVGLTEKRIGPESGSAIALTNTPFIILINHNKELPQKVYTDLMLRVSNVFSSNLAGFNSLDEFKRQITVNGIDPKNIIILLKDEIHEGKKLEDLIYTLDEQSVSSGENKNGLSPEMEIKINNYFKEADKAVQDLITTYPYAKDSDSEQANSFAQDALYQEIQLIKKMEAKGMNMLSNKKVAIEKYLELYSDSSEALLLAKEWEYGNNYDFSNAQKAVYVNNDYHVFSVKRFKAIDEDAKSFELNINGKSWPNSERPNSRKFYEGDKIPLTGNDYLIVKDIENRQVKVEYYYKVSTSDDKLEEKRGGSPSFVYNPNSVEDQRVNKLTLLSTKEKEIWNITITDITVTEVASVSLIPEMSTKSEANFTFKIGIEKRAIKLNPEKAAEQADELNKTIKEWEERNAQLGKLVESWKAACLVTGLGLQVKNLLTGFEGKSMARVEVMKSYRQECESNLSLKDLTPDQCYNKLSSQIGKDVDAYGKAIDSVNEQISKYESFEKWRTSYPEETINLEGGKSLTTKDFTSWEDARAYLLCKQVKCDPVSGSIVSENVAKEIKADKDSRLKALSEIKDLSKGVVSLQTSLNDGYKNAAVSLEKTKATTYSLNYYELISVDALNKSIDYEPSKTNPAYQDLQNYLQDKNKDLSLGRAVAELGTEKKLIIVQAPNTAAVSVAMVLNVTGNGPFIISGKDDTLAKELAVNYVGGKPCLSSDDKDGYKNPKARFYDYGNSKGMPAVVPFDKKGGWYVYVKDSLGGILSDNSKGYFENGMVNNFMICNVGVNGIEQLGAGDDNCQSFNGNNPANTQAFGSCKLTTSYVKNTLAPRAQEAIREAARQYGKGDRITIKGSGFDKIPVEPGLSGGSELYECQDFMSPEDCKLMYNVCDPVVCPASRCDLGGRAPVSNVIQSGIVGSLLLCMPNSVLLGGDVYVPVCLTGIHAGIDGYIQILKAQQSCLAEYSKSGKHVGICDAMTALYTCDFLWRQTAPLLQGIIPSLFQSLYTGKIGSSSGGGEYASFQSSWDNMQKSIDYFKNTYAKTSFRALKFSDVQSFGTEVCNMYVGSSFPTSVEGIDQLLEPESPPQFHATFAEVPFTEATVPPTSQYKVTYMIYAGKQQGVSYTVYLKNPPATSYYQTAQTVRVKVGYIAAGQQVSESKDFTAPSGYKELCVIVGGQEECGFTTVSSSFAVDSLHDAYAKEQGATTDIKTEKECIQGSPSALALVNINAQEGVENAIDPNIALQGIVRVCATENPGLGTQRQPKWKEVGYCGDENLKCWLDLDSVNKDAMNVLDNVATIKEAQDAIAKSNSIGVKVLTEPEVQDKLIALKANISKLKATKETSSDDINKQVDPLLKDIEVISNFGGHEVFKAQAYSLRYELYSAVVHMLLDLQNPVSEPNVASEKTVEIAESAEETSSADDSPIQSEKAESKNIVILNGAFSFDNKIYSVKLTNAQSKIYLIEDASEDKKFVVTENKKMTGIDLSIPSLSNLKDCVFSSTEISCP